MTEDKKAQLEAAALKVRQHIIDLSTDGGCFIGASLSCADIIVYLYHEYLNISPETIDDPNRDILLLSKGHDVPALYATLAEKGYFEVERLKNHLSTEDHIYWHPNTNIPGIEYYSGSLGHLPSVGLGIALDIRMRGGDNSVFVITGDGELDEGSVWEAVLVSAAHKVNNICFIVDRNEFQANLPTEELIPLEPLADKFEAFGAVVKRIDGHDFEALDKAFSAFPFHTEKPSVIICDTVRGKGLPSIERKADRWFVNFTKEETEGLHKELLGGDETQLHSEKLTVR